MFNFTRQKHRSQAWRVRGVHSHPVYLVHPQLSLPVPPSLFKRVFLRATTSSQGNRLSTLSRVPGASGGI